MTPADHPARRVAVMAVLGAAVLFVLAVVFVFAYAMKVAFWRDVH